VPLFGGETGLDGRIGHAVDDDGGSDVATSGSAFPYKKFQVVCDRIADVMALGRSDCDRLKVQVFQDVCCIDPNAILRQLCETFIHVQSSFRSGRRVVVPSLICEQCHRKVPEFRRIDSFDGEASFMGHRRGRMPRLNLMTKDEADSGVVFLEGWKDVLIQLVQHDFTVRTDVVDVEFDCVTARLADMVSCESWIESHLSWTWCRD